MDGILILVVGMLALATGLIKGLRWGFCWIYVPVLVLVPHSIFLKISGVPDLNAQAAAGLGLILAWSMGRRSEVTHFRWRWFDMIALAPVVTFSFSYALDTDFKGFCHRFVVLIFSWTCPYLFSRLLIKNIRDVQFVLKPLAFSSILLAFMSIWECRMATRVASVLWDKAGFSVPVLSHYGYLRWGFLRANASFIHPITLGTFFAAITPLMVVWGLLQNKFRWLPWIATLACLAGGISSLSRGPILIMFLAVLVPVMAAVPKKMLIPLSLIGLVLFIPIFLEVASETVDHTQQEMDSRGNTTSGYYRVALLLIYGKQLENVGWWGDSSVRTNLEYEAAWSVDNAYLFLFLMGGWLGGGAVFAIVIFLLFGGAWRLFHASGREKYIDGAIVGSMIGISGCMADVWFAPDYTPFFWIISALVFNQVWLKEKDASLLYSSPAYASKKHLLSQYRRRDKYKNTTRIGIGQ